MSVPKEQRVVHTYAPTKLAASSALADLDITLELIQNLAMVSSLQIVI